MGAPEDFLKSFGERKTLFENGEAFDYIKTSRKQEQGLTQTSICFNILNIKFLLNHSKD